MVPFKLTKLVSARGIKMMTSLMQRLSGVVTLLRIESVLVIIKPHVISYFIYFNCYFNNYGG